ncbi:uncharacterized protein A4U43_C08F7350 [Asparagus officinalis]|nr:uncharacterized protein A4U43_C08F7350 [Asparagus officinalis]
MAEDFGEDVGGFGFDSVRVLRLRRGFFVREAADRLLGFSKEVKEIISWDYDTQKALDSGTDNPTINPFRMQVIH